jgi:hypothetical protein
MRCFLSSTSSRQKRLQSSFPSFFLSSIVAKIPTTKVLGWILLASFLVGGLGVWLVRQFASRHTSSATVVKTRIIFKDRILTKFIQVPVPTPPEQTIIYLPDTTRRHALERSTIVSGVKIDGHELNLETIDPRGVTRISTYPLPEHGNVLISDTGAVSVSVDCKTQRRELWKRRLRRTGFVVAIVAAALVGNLAAKRP